MKKKFKLFTTIASLCLAVAIMAFGVYAAGNVTHNINGVVKFDMTDVFVQVTTNLTCAEKTTIDAEQDFSAEKLQAQMGVEVDKNALLDGKGNFATYDPETNQKVETWSTEGLNNVTGIVYNFNEASVWKLVVTITNNNATGVTVAITEPTVPEEDNYTLVAIRSYVEDPTDDEATVKPYTSEAKLPQGSKLTLTYYLAIEDLTKAIGETPTNFSFVIEQAPTE